MTVHHDYTYQLGLRFLHSCHPHLSDEFLRERLMWGRSHDKWLDSWECYEFNLWIKEKTQEDFRKLINWMQDLHDLQAAMLDPQAFPFPARHYASRAERNAGTIPDQLHEPLLRIVRLLGTFHKEERSESMI